MINAQMIYMQCTHFKLNGKESHGIFAYRPGKHLWWCAPSTVLPFKLLSPRNSIELPFKLFRKTFLSSSFQGDHYSKTEIRNCFSFNSALFTGHSKAKCCSGRFLSFLHLCLTTCCIGREFFTSAKVNYGNLGSTAWTVAMP